MNPSISSLDRASIAHWLEHDEHAVDAAFDVRVARWKIAAIHEPTPILHDDCPDCRRHGYPHCQGHAEIAEDLIDPPRTEHEDWHALYAGELAGCPPFGWRLEKSLREVWHWARLTEREIKALDMWLLGERQELIAHAIHTSKTDVRPIVETALAAIRERVADNSSTGPANKSTEGYAFAGPDDVRAGIDGRRDTDDAAGRAGPGPRRDLPDAPPGAAWVAASESAA